MKIKSNPFLRPARFVAALALTLAAIPADAANLTWTTTPGGTITEGGGTWTTGAAGWRNVSGAADANWAANDSAIFGGGTAGTAGTVTLGGNISAAKITFNAPFAGNYTLDLAGNTLTTSSITGSITAGTTTTIISDSAGTGGWNISNIGLNAALSNMNGGLVTVNAKVTGAGNMYVGGGGAVTLNNDANNFTGLLGKQNGNALTISSIKNSGVASAAGAGNKVQVGDSGIIIYNGSGDSTDRTLEIRGAGSATLRNNGGSGALIWTGPITNTSTLAKTFTLGGSNTANNELRGILANNGANVLSVTKADAGTWVLSGNNTYTGLTTLSAGTLTLSGNNSGTGGVTLTAGTLNINSATALGATASAFNINGGTIDNTSGSAKTLANNNPITLGGSFAYGTSAGTAANNLNLGTGAVSIGASRTITLNGAGALTFGGVLTNTAAAGMSVTVNKGTGTTSTSAVNFGGVSITAAGDTLGRNLFFYGDGNINVTGAIVNGAGTGSGALQINTTGILTLTGTNSYTGATGLFSGVLDAIDGTGVPTSSSIQLKGGVFQSSGTFTRAVANGNGKVNWGGTGNSGGFAARGGVLNLQLNNGTGSLTWGNAFTQVAGDGFSLIFGSATADNRVDFKNGLNLGNSTVATRTITVIDNPNSTADIARISGNITETTAGMGLLKDGAGTLELTGSNTYSGLTTVSAGTLAVNGSAAGAMSVASGATLQGNGTISGATTVSGNLKPGNSPGLLTFASSLTLDSTAATTMEITGANSSGTLGTTYDAVNVANALTYGGTLALNFDTLFTQTGNYTFNLFDFNSTSGSFGSVSLAGVYSGSFTNTDNSGIWDLTDGDNSWSFNQGDGILTFTVIPEPNVAMVVGSLALMTLLRRRRD